MASYSPRKDKNGQIISYQIKVTRGRDRITGKQLTPFTMTYTPPTGWSKKAVERELLKVMGEFEAACNRGEVLTKEQEKALVLQEIEENKRKQAEEERKPTFSRYIEIYMNEKATISAPGTIENYRNILRKAESVFGAMKMEDIDFLKVKQYIIDLQSNGKNDFNGKPLSYNTILKHFIVLHALFENAVENEILQLSPMQNMKRPKPRKDEVMKESIVYTENEIQNIIECLNQEPLKWKALIMFAIDSGCRRGEIIGLKWEEIDFNTGKVNICRNAQYTSGKGTYVSTPKNGKSRIICLNEPVLKVLSEWKRKQAILHLAQGLPNNGFCFTQDNGKMMNPQAPTSYLSRFGKKYNLPGIHPHALRHTMATISIVNGADIVSVSKKLGHSNTSITLDVYSHANEEAQQRANNVLAEAIYIKKHA